MRLLKKLLLGALFTVSVLVLLNHILLIPSIVSGMREVASGMPVSPGGPPPGFLGPWLVITTVSGLVAWQTGRSLFGRVADCRPNDG